MPEQTVVSKPLLYGGISKQATHLRHPSQVDDASNVDFSPAFGAFTRAGTKLVANLGNCRVTIGSKSGSWAVGQTVSRTTGSPAFSGWIVAIDDAGTQITIQVTSGTFTATGVTTSGGGTATITTIWSQWATGTDLRLQPIARDETERYLLIQGPNGYPRIIPVGSSLGKEAVLVEGGSTLTYLQANTPTAADYRYCTIHDTTYIVNSKKKMGGVNYHSVSATTPVRLEQGVITASTMPHTIKRTSLSPLTFTFNAETWFNRDDAGSNYGTSASNPLPIAIGGFPYTYAISTPSEGSAVSEIAVFNGRLMLVAGGYIMFSAINSYTNFWYADPAAVVDSDTVRFALPGAYADRATALRKTIIFGTKENQQYEASYSGDSFTPFTATLAATTSIRSVPGVEMPRFQTGVLVPSVSNDCGTLHYYDYDDLALSYTTRPMSAHVESLMESSITRVVADTTTGFAGVVTDNDGSTIYAMRLAYIDGKQVQNAWGKWFFGDDGLTRVCDVAIIGGVLYVLSEYAGAYYVHGMTLGSPLSATTETLLTGASVSASGESMAADA